ncbi:MAG: acyl-CoA/acyl-ACP dehydrogenase, partial [Novosphingobium sp.]|nr:acyl-CoA/acyl-ACP dehydrogenase [Novosphingobium sp.]
MWHELTSEQELLRDTTARYLDDRAPLAALRKDRDNPAGFDPAYWSGGAELGWTMLLVSEEDGGGSVSGRGLVDLALIAFEFGRHAAPGPLVDCNVVAAALGGQAGDWQAAALAELLSGAAIASCCLGVAPWQEPGEASVSIRQDDADLVINGAVKPVESAAQAGWFLVTGMSEGGMSQALVPAGTPGLSVRPLKA